MKIIGLLLTILGIVAIVLTVLLPAQLGYAGLFAGATAILTGVVFLAACHNRRMCCCECCRNDDDCCC